MLVTTANELVHPTLNPNLKYFWLAPARNRVLYGGRSSSKTRDTSGFALFLAQAISVRIMCTRQFQSSVERSVYAVLVDQIERFGLQGKFHITQTKIVCPSTGSEFLFFGRARNTSEIKGTEDVDIHWAEEAELMTPEEWRIIDATLKGEGSQHWIVFNPRFSSDFVYQRFVVNPPPDTIIRKINYDENPFLSQTQLKVIEGLKNEDIEEYNHVYLGAPLTDDDKVIIKLSWIEAAIDAHVKLKFNSEGQNTIGFDVGDEGDPCANIHAHGSVVLWGEEWQGREDELLKSCIKTYNNAKRLSADIRYDCIGVGAHAGGKFDELNVANNTHIKYSKFNAGAAVYEPEKFYIQNRLEQIKNKDYFGDLKAQVWWLVADRFRNTYDAIHNGTQYPVDQLISISSSMPKLTKLKMELSTPRRDFDQNGRVKVESKKDLRRREVPSPNMADAFVMCFAPAIKSMRISDKVLQGF